MTRPLHIAIDASRTSVARHTGTEHYALQLTRHLTRLNHQLEQPHQITLYFRDQRGPALFQSWEYVTHRVLPFPRLWTHLRFARAIAHDRPDVTFVPAHTLPIAFPGRAVVTVHDLGYKYFPEAHPTLQRRYLDSTTAYSAQRATRILADSQATANDLTQFYAIEPSKIDVVYPGVDELEISDMMRLQDRYNLPFRYFLFIGTLQPRKNIQRIVAAFQMWRDANPSEPMALVLAGKAGWLFDEKWVEGVEDVHLPGYIADEDKGALLHHAEALLFPSLYEGFGFPVLEAMHCGTPVIASKTSSLPELVGDAGMLVDPESVQEIAAAMDILGASRKLYKTLVKKGFQQAEQFTWERCAAQVMATLETAATQ